MEIVTRSVGVTERVVEALPGWARDGFELVALLGDWMVLVAILGVVMLGTVFTRARRGADQLCGARTVFVVAVVFGGLALTLLLKALFDAPRPPAELHAVTPSPGGFPSGHVMVATIGWGAILWWLVDMPRRYRAGALAVLVVFVALSRLALGVHFLVDVVASVVFGGLYLAAVVWVTDERPGRAFAVAIALGLGATLVSGGETRPLLALAGTAGAAVGWLLIESAPVRQLLIRVFQTAGRQS